MPSYKAYKIIHLLSIGAVLVAISGLTFHAWAGGTKEQAGTLRTRLLAVHGAGMFGVLLGGMGLGATSGAISTTDGWQWWIFPKLVIWLAYGVLPALAYRIPKRGGTLLTLTLALLGAAAWLAGGMLPLTR
jgi:hypothetical protein